jgi:hypothetical protein
MFRLIPRYRGRGVPLPLQYNLACVGDDKHQNEQRIGFTAKESGSLIRGEASKGRTTSAVVPLPGEEIAGATPLAGEAEKVRIALICVPRLPPADASAVLGITLQGLEKFLTTGYGDSVSKYLGRQDLT